MTYRAAPVTQRDGSSLANSNCRMASIATGIDYDTLGAQRSTGSAMRSRTSDQSGGTDSGDAAEAWASYGQSLRVRDGYAFADALEDLHAGRLVHLDVWHASVSGSGICHSGTGAYGHTIAVAPERNSSGSWLVADPWCSPARWGWVAEAELRQGAEEWGGRVYSRALEEPDYPTGGPGPRDPRVLAIVRRIVQRFMSASYPGHESQLPPGPDTGGGGAILFTTTAAQSEGDDMQHVKLGASADGSGRPESALDMLAGEKWLYLDGAPGGSFSGDARVLVYGTVDSEANHHAVRIRTGVPYDDGKVRDTLVRVDTTRALVPLPPPEDPDDATRDEQWREWLLAGSPGSEG